MWLISLFFCFCLNVFLPHVQLLFLPDKQFPSTTEQTWLLFFFFTIQFLFFFFLFSDFLFESFQKMSTQHFNVSYPKTSKENIHVIPFLYGWSLLFIGWSLFSLCWPICFSLTFQLVGTTHVLPSFLLSLFLKKIAPKTVTNQTDWHLPFF